MTVSRIGRNQSWIHTWPLLAMFGVCVSDYYVVCAICVARGFLLRVSVIQALLPLFSFGSYYCLAFVLFLLHRLIVARVHLPLEGVGEIKLALLDLLTRRREHGLWQTH